jgi:hypothetical protein
MRKQSDSLIGLCMAAVVLCPSSIGLALTVSGRVYEGNVGDESKPLSGVTVTLYASNNSGQQGTYITSTTTDSQGWYGLEVEGAFDYFNVVETDPGGYSSVGATTVSGSVINSNWIQYDSLGLQNTTTGNKFWDKKEETPPENRPPVAQNDSASTTEGTPVNINVLTNDSDPDNDPLSIQSVTDPPHGTAVRDGQSVRYTPDSGFAGSDSFDYTISDGRGGTASATVTVRVGEAPPTQTATISGYKFNDTDGDGIWGPGESGLAGWTIFADMDPYNARLDPGEPSDVTGPDGSYRLTDLAPGVYNVYEVAQAGWQVTYPSAGFYGITVHANDLYDRQDFGNHLEGGELVEACCLPDGSCANLTPEQCRLHGGTPQGPGTVCMGDIDGDGIDDICEGQPPTGEFDFGDAPDSYGTLHASGGAYHDVNPALCLGLSIDGEPDGQPNASATGDDSHGGDDEDGVLFISSLQAGSQATLRVSVSAPQNTYVNVTGWIDFDGDGQWQDPQERVFSDNTWAPVTLVKTFLVPTDAQTGAATFARFRLCRADPGADFLPSPRGYGGEGEVEDYQVQIGREGTPTTGQDYTFDVCFDVELTLPDGSVHRLSLSGPATERVSIGPNGEASDTNGNGRDDASAELVDLQLTGVDPVLGSVRMVLNPAMSSVGQVEERINNTPGIFDIPPFTASGSADSFFDVWFQVELPSYGLTVLSSQSKRLVGVIDHLPPASSAYSEPSPTTIELVDQSGKPTGLRLGPLTSCQAQYRRDYGDAPLPYPEASHLLGGPYMGPFGDLPDADAGMQRDAQALGDDHDGDGDDENGLLSIDLVKTPGAWSIWDFKGCFNGSSDAKCAFWIDFNGDGDWDDQGELVASFGFCGFQSGPQDWFRVTSAFVLPAQANVGTTYARLRVYDDCSTTVSPSGAGGPGEVEDYAVEIKADGAGVPPGGIVHGYKWNDLDGDGLWDILVPNEPPLAGWTIWLDTNHSGKPDAGDMTTQTDAQGHFRFTGVPAGTYLLGEQLQTGWTQTTPGGPGTYSVTVQPGQASFPQMFGNRQSGGPTSDGRICGSKWNDLNGDGLYDAGEPYLSGWTIYLDINQNGRLDPGEPSQLTDATGGFEFTGLAVGSYTVAEEMQAGWQQTWPGGAGTHTINIQSGGVQPLCVMFGNTERPVQPPDTLKKLDWGDAPDPTYPTLRASNGAYHVIVLGFYLGQGIDDEPDGQPAPDALGDDHSGADDEDGVVFLTPLLPGGTAQLEVTASAAGLVDAWIDFDGDGSWSQSGDQILKSQHVTSGSNVLSVSVPASAPLNVATFARFRLSRTTGLGPDGPAQAGEVEDYHVFIGPDGPGVPGEGQRPHVKWSQPPVEIDPNVQKPPVFCGWNEPARSTQSSGQSRQWRMDADDFHCLGPIPITGLRWWGGYKAWEHPEPPESQPLAWHIGFWANQVENLEPGQVYPERLVWSLEIPNERVERVPAGSSESLQQTPAMCFLYEVRLAPDEWFRQAEFPSNGGVFWLSITAIYPVDAEQTNQWGWMVRPHVWGRGAVMPAIMGEWPTYDERLFPGRITPIESSVLCGQNRAYDLCFELLTDEPWIKWDQPFMGTRDWPDYEDLESQGTSIRQQENIGRQVADDWTCEGNTPVIAAAWWGSYIGYGYEACQCDRELDPPRPDYFLLRLWRSVPASDSVPAQPGEVVWEYRAFDYDEVLVGYDGTPEREPIYRYSVRLPEEQWFRQEVPGTVWWFSVTAVYTDPLPMLVHPWGWTNHPPVSENGAVSIDYRAGPAPEWQRLRDPQDRPVDMSFTLFTLPEEPPP